MPDFWLGSEDRSSWLFLRFFSGGVACLGFSKCLHESFVFFCRALESVVLLGEAGFVVGLHLVRRRFPVDLSPL